MDDIVQRLRDKAFAHPPPDRGPRIEDEAADEIERLRAALKSCISWMPNCPARTDARLILSDTE